MVANRVFALKPPASFPVHPYIASLAPPALPITTAPSAAPSTKHQSLIERYNLTAAVRAQEKGKGRAIDDEMSETVQSKVWNADKSAREKTLQDRKAKMILEARQ